MDPDAPRPHVVLIPSAGMGHLTPFSRLAASLSNFCHVTLLSILPTVSSAESHQYNHLFSSYPNIHPLHFQLPPADSLSSADPFFLRWKHLRESAADIFTHIVTNPRFPISAIIADITIAVSVLPLTKKSGIPCYILFTSSAAMLSFFKQFPVYRDSNPSGVITDIELPGLRTVPLASIPRPLHDPTQLFAQSLVKNSRSLGESDGVIINSFEFIERDSLDWLSGQPGFPPVIPVGPLPPIKTPKSTVSDVLTWLGKQPEKSVVYISFGSRTAMPKEQIRELGLGLETTNCRFLWVIKTSVVDTEDRTELEELLGEGFVERVKERGMVTKGWVEQEEVLRHGAVGGFLSHCGWNSVTEAAMHGVRVLAWPRLGDQRINADVVARSGLGIWPENWSWEGEEGIVKADEIGRRVKEMMADENLLETARKVGQAARSAAGNGLAELVRKLEGLV